MGNPKYPYTGNIQENSLRALETLGNWFHAAPQKGARGIDAIPSRHRLYNAAGGIAGWLIGRHVMNILVGETPKGEPINKNKLPKYLQPLHGILAYNRYADDAKNQWMRVIDDLTPAALGAVGAVLGSKYFFLGAEEKLENDLRAALQLKPGEALPRPDIIIKNQYKNIDVDARLREQLASLQQAKTWRLLSGIAGIFSSTSGLALLAFPGNFLNYGESLNKAFILAAGRKEMVGLAEWTRIESLRKISNTQSNTVYGPATAISALIHGVSHGGALHGTEINTSRIEQYVNAILKPWFKNVTPNQIKSFQNEITNRINGAINEAEKSGIANETKRAEKISELIQVKMKDFLGIVKDAKGNEIFDAKKLNAAFGSVGLDPKNLTPGNNGMAAWFGSNPGKVAGMLGGALGFGVLANASTGDKKAIENKKVHPDSPFKKHEQAQPSKNPITRFVNGPILRFARWLSDAVINVPPQNRFFSVVGLCAGLFIGYRGMRALAGREFVPANPVAKADLHPYLRWMHNLYGGAKGIFSSPQGFDYYADDNRNRWLRAAFWIVPTVTGAIGTYFGSKYAFRKQYKELEHAEFLEDYSAKISLAQGDKWGIASATASVLASPSGFSNLPIPGINYAIGLSTRSVLSYDKRVAMPGVGRLWSNNKSSYYMGLKGMLDYTIQYATRNTTEEPKELVALAEATLQPFFPKVTREQVADYVEKIQDVRKKYWGEEGIPKEQLKDAQQELRAMLRGEGFERTLELIGLNPAEAVFNNGASGKLADAVGAKSTTQSLAKEYRGKYEKRHKERLLEEEYDAKTPAQESGKLGKSPQQEPFYTTVNEGPASLSKKAIPSIEQPVEKRFTERDDIRERATAHKPTPSLVPVSHQERLAAPSLVAAERQV